MTLLDKLKEAHEEATAGPWRTHKSIGYYPAWYVNYFDKERGYALAVGRMPEEADACIIALVHNHLDKLLEVVDAIDRLAGEVQGCWGMDERGLRSVLGNTNYHVVEEKLEHARQVLAPFLEEIPE